MNFPTNLSNDQQKDIIEMIYSYDIIINEQSLDAFLQYDDIAALHLFIQKIRQNIYQNWALIPQYYYNPQLIENVRNGRLIQFIIELITRNISNQLSFDAIWILTIITTNTKKKIQQMAKFGGIDLFLSLLDSEYLPIIDLALFGLGNICRNCNQMRSDLLKHDIISRMIQVNLKLNDKNNLIWLIYHLTTPPLPQNYIQSQFQFIPILADYIIKYTKNGMIQDNKDTLFDALSSLSYITYYEQSFNYIFNINGFLEAIKQLLIYTDYNLQICAQIILGNLSTGNYEQTQQILKIGCQKIMLQLLKGSKNHKLIENILWTLSNICLVNEQQASIILHESDMIRVLQNLLIQYQGYDLQIEALTLISNLLTAVSEMDAQFLLDNGLIQLLAQQFQGLTPFQYVQIVLDGFWGLSIKNFKQINVQLGKILQDFYPTYMDPGENMQNQIKLLFYIINKQNNQENQIDN